MAKATAGDWAISAATVVAGLVALGAIANGLRRWYSRTLGRRRDAYERLARLGTSAQLSFFEAVLGEPPAIRRTVTKDAKELVYQDDPRFDPALADPDDPVHLVRTPRDFRESIFIDRDYYVQTITDADDTVLAFSVTTRQKRFNPKFEWPQKMSWRERRRWKQNVGETYKPLFRVRLGRTRFSDFGDEEREDFAGPHFKISVGAHNYTYSEFESFGNPGAYQSFVFTASDVAPGGFGDGSAVMAEIGGWEWPRQERDEVDDEPETFYAPPTGDPDGPWNGLHAARRFRRHTVVTTYTVVGMDLWMDNYPTTFGPHINWVRTLP